MDIEELVDAWRVNNAVNLELLELVADEDLELKPGKGKTIRSNFVHLVGVRKMWAEEKLRKDAALIPKLDWRTATRKELLKGLQQSSELMSNLFRKMAEAKKPGKSILNFFAYCIAHEAHHRSQIEIALRLNGREPEDAVLYRLWEWGKK